MPVIAGENLIVRALRAEELPVLRALRREALATDPGSFGATAADDLLLRADYDPGRLNRPGETATLGAWLAGELIGMSGLYRHQGSKFHHKLQLWGMYVSASARGGGVARQLLEATLAEARRWPDALFVQLCVNRESEAAWQLYASAGFIQWGEEPGGFRQPDGRLINDRHLSLCL